MNPSLWPTEIFCQHGPKNLQLTKHGRLQDMTLAVKDLFSIQGFKHAAGNPSWLASHPPAKETALALQTLLEQGAVMQSYVHTDELAYSLEGNNMHYGCAENPAKPGHVCGGSSMGCAAAVAGGYSQVGLGTDTGGSIRVPACYTGLYGIRPSFGLVSTQGLTGLAPEFDTIGWLSKQSKQLQNIGQVLLPEQTIHSVNKLVVCRQLIELVEPDCYSSLIASLELLKPHFAEYQEITMPASLLADLSETFRVLQALSVAKTHKNWLNEYQPSFAPAINERFKMALNMDPALAPAARLKQQKIQSWLATHLNKSTCLFLPTTPSTAPAIGADVSRLRTQTMQLTAICGLTGACQVHLPLTSQSLDGPYGFSLLMAAGSDLSLLSSVTQISQLKDWKR